MPAIDIPTVRLANAHPSATVKALPPHRVAANPIVGEPRGRLLSELCGHPQTAAELAERVGTSRNAVRVHLDALRLAGLVEFGVERRGVGKPTHVYALTESAEYFLSAAYAPALRAILLRLQRERAGGLGEWLRGVGEALAPAQATASTPDVPADTALQLLRDLGAVASLETNGNHHVLQSACCPLGAVTRNVPETCKLLEGALSATLPEFSIEEHCERGDHPRCRFLITAGA